MKKTVLMLLLLSFLIPASLFQVSRAAAQEESQQEEPASGAVVCIPGMYLQEPEDCLPLGPSQTLTELARQGIPYPVLPLPAAKPAYEFNILPYLYFKVSEDGADLYDSLEAAAGNEPYARLESGFLYVSYVGREQDEDGHYYYRLRSGSLIGVEGGRLAVPEFQGLVFSSQPRRSFGWILGETRLRVEPGLNAPESGNTYYRYQIVQIYAIQQTSGLTWYLVAPGQWVESRLVSRVDPRSDIPPGIPSDRWIDVNLFEQTVAVYDGGRMVFATLVATGVKPYWTRPGIFQIYEKKDVETMSGTSEADRSDYYYLEDVPWTMYFDEKRALHGAYWHNGFGYARSHGCVNLSVGDSHWLFDWAQEGDTVFVYDPSGETPVDSSVYGAGAP